MKDIYKYGGHGIFSGSQYFSNEQYNFEVFS